jgi:hypothetical protein
MGRGFTVFIYFTSIIALLLAPFLMWIEPAQAIGAINAQVDGSKTTASIEGQTAKIKFVVSTIYNGPLINDSKEITNGNATGSFAGNIDESMLTKLPYTSTGTPAVEAKKYKINSSTFAPKTLTWEGETTRDDSSKWNNIFFLTVKRAHGDLIGYFWDQNSPNFNPMGNPLADSVQESLIFATNKNGIEGYVLVTDTSGAAAGGTLSEEQAKQLAGQYDLANSDGEGSFTVTDVSGASATQAPTLKLLPKSGGTSLEFQLKSVYQTYGSKASDNYLFWFKSKEHSNLWVVIDIEGQAEIVLQSSPSEKREVVIHGSLNSDEFAANRNSFDSAVISRVFNECDEGSSGCAAGNYLRFINHPDTQTKFSSKGTQAYNDAIASSLNKKVPTTCDATGKLGSGNLNCNQNSWLDKWGVTYETVESSLIDLPCGINELFNGDLGEAFDKMTDCLFEQIFVPLLKWATGLVENAAGISLAPGCCAIISRNEGIDV